MYQVIYLLWYKHFVHLRLMLDVYTLYVIRYIMLYVTLRYTIRCIAFLRCVTLRFVLRCVTYYYRK